MNDTRSRIIKGISFWKGLTGPRYNSSLAAAYMPKFIELLEDYFGLKGSQLELENPAAQAENEVDELPKPPKDSVRDWDKLNKLAENIKADFNSKNDDAEFMEKLISQDTLPSNLQ